jgi:hypothetical protein
MMRKTEDGESPIVPIASRQMFSQRDEEGELSRSRSPRPAKVKTLLAMLNQEVALVRHEHTCPLRSVRRVRV